MKKNRGFTLMELIIAVAIISILVAIAYPSYQEHVTQSRRADAKAALMGFAQAMERAYTIDGSYTGLAANGATVGAPTIYATTSPLDSSDVYYNLTIQSAAASAYIVSAMPINAQAGDGELILKSTGAKGWDSDASGTIDSDELCWKSSC